MRHRDSVRALCINLHVLDVMPVIFVGHCTSDGQLIPSLVASLRQTAECSPSRCVIIREFHNYETIC